MAAGFGYGQGTPNDSGDDFNIISFIVRQLMLNIATAKFVKVVAFKAGDGSPGAPGTVDVQPLVKQVDGNNNTVPHGTIYGVPVLRQGGGKHAFVADPVAGDVGVVLCLDRDSSAVKETWKESPPGSLRSHDLADSVYVGGGFGAAPDTYVQLNADGVKIADKAGNIITTTTSGVSVTDKTGNVLQTDATGINATPKAGLPFKVNGNLVVTGNLLLGGDIEGEPGGTYPGDLKVQGNVIAGFGTGDAVGVQTHTHQYDRPSGASAPAQSVKPTAGT